MVANRAQQIFCGLLGLIPGRGQGNEGPDGRGMQLLTRGRQRGGVGELRQPPLGLAAGVEALDVGPGLGAQDPFTRGAEFSSHALLKMV